MTTTAFDTYRTCWLQWCVSTCPVQREQAELIMSHLHLENINMPGWLEFLETLPGHNESVVRDSLDMIAEQRMRELGH